MEPILVVGALVERDGRLLLARRAPTERHAGLWELPGGKVEPGETPQAALRRELAEELGVEAEVEASGPEYGAVIDGKAFRFIVLKARWEGEPAFLAVHDAVAWIRRGEASDYNVAPLDSPALEDWERGEGSARLSSAEVV